MRGLSPEATEGVRTFTVGAVSFNMVYVEPGTFQMGSNDGDSDEKPVHTVTLTQGYWMGETEVTQALWEKVMGKNPSAFKGPQNPVETVSWNDCTNFVAKLNALQQGSGVTFRLPTEAEWEYAARGGKQSKGTKYSGSDTLGDVAWNDGSGTHPVKGKKANELGLYDMSGNVWEWCQDVYSSVYYKQSPKDNPTGPASGDYRVYRGGSWNYVASYCRVANRNCDYPGFRNFDLGLRLAASAGLQSALPEASRPEGGTRAAEADPRDAGGAERQAAAASARKFWRNEMSQFATFHVGPNGGEAAAAELNGFLRSHRVLKVDRAAFPDGWTFCVEWMPLAGADADGPVAGVGRRHDRVDYMKVLGTDEFARFARLRERRKSISVAEGIPPYAIFTDEQLAAVARIENPGISDLRKVDGIAEGRVEKYGARILAESVS